MTFFNGTSCHWRFGAKMTRPVSGSTAPGAPMPTRAHLLEIQIALIHGITDATGDAIDDFVGAALRLGAHFGAAQACKFVVKNAGQNLGAAEIDADEIFGFGAGVGHIRR